MFFIVYLDKKLFIVLKIMLDLINEKQSCLQEHRNRDIEFRFQNVYRKYAIYQNSRMISIELAHQLLLLDECFYADT